MAFDMRNFPRVKRELPKLFSNHVRKHYIIMADGRKGRKCELCGEVKREKFMTTRVGHDVCIVCARSPRRQMKAIMNERGNLFIQKKFLKSSEARTLIDIYKAQGLSPKQINQRLKRLRTELYITKELKKFKLGIESGKVKPSFNQEFSKLAGFKGDRE